MNYPNTTGAFPDWIDGHEVRVLLGSDPGRVFLAVEAADGRTVVEVTLTHSGAAQLAEQLLRSAADALEGTIR